MEINEAKLTHFLSVILGDARREADAVYAEIQAETEAFLNDAEDAALAEAYRYIRSEVTKIQALCGRRLSKTLMENKRALFTRREEMADEVTNMVRNRLAAYAETPAYAVRLVGTLTEILCIFDADTTVYLRPEDSGMIEILQKVPTLHTVTFAEGDFSLGGMEADCPSQKRHADATFDTSLCTLREHFFELFGLKLGDA